MRQHTYTYYSIFFITFFILFTYSSLRAEEEYYEISKSYRALGMGGVFYSVSDDEYALFYNPSGLHRYHGGTRIMAQTQAEVAPPLINAFNTFNNLKGASTSTIVTDITNYTNQALYGGVTPLYAFYLDKNFSFGLLFADTKLDVLLTGSGVDITTGWGFLSDSGFVVGYANQFFDNDLSLGATLKGIFRLSSQGNFSIQDIIQGQTLNIAESQGQGFGMDMDLGGMYRLPWNFAGEVEHLSLSINNIFASPLTMLFVKNTPAGLPRLISFGWSSEFPLHRLWDFQKLLVALDIAEFELGGPSNPYLGARDGSFFKHLNLGSELTFSDFLFVRAGIHQGNITFGLGGDFRFFKFDIMTYAEELGLLPGTTTSRRYGVRLVFGWSDESRKGVQKDMSIPTKVEMSPD